MDFKRYQARQISALLKATSSPPGAHHHRGPGAQQARRSPAGKSVAAGDGAALPALLGKGVWRSLAWTFLACWASPAEPSGTRAARQSKAVTGKCSKEHYLDSVSEWDLHPNTW